VTVVICGGLTTRPARESSPQSFVFFNLDRHRIAETSFLENANIAGAQVKYTWRELEPERDLYDLEPLFEDLTFLERHGKRLFVQLQDVSFDERINVPDYLIDPEFGGGVARKYEVDEDDDAPPEFDGWVARRWDPAVIARLAKLLQALGDHLDGRIEGINLAETSIAFENRDELRPSGYSPEAYANGVRATMSAARNAFSESRVIQYANFMPGEWLPWEDHGYLRGVYAHAERIGVGVGGPDLLPFRAGQRNHSHKLIAARAAHVMAGLAVQDGNLDEIDPATGSPVTIERLYRYASDSLRLDYLFWGTQEPHYSTGVVPFIRALPEKEDGR
jgi:hypothetical protein